MVALGPSDRLVLSAITSRAALSRRRAHDLVAQHVVADLDLAGRRRGDADHLVLDDGGFSDARLRASGACRKACGKSKHGNTKAAVTPVHFSTDRLMPPSYRTGPRAMLQIYHKRYVTNPLVGDREYGMRSTQWT